MAEKIYPKGIVTFKKNDKAPSFVLGTIVITPNELNKWLKENLSLLTEYKGEKQLKLQVLQGKEKLTLVVDTWKPAEKVEAVAPAPICEPEVLPTDDLPF